MAKGGLRRWTIWVIAVAAFLLAWALISSSIDKSEDDAEKRTCELVYGAGLCVKSGGEWVRIGS